MDTDQALLRVLRDAGEPLHWTVIQDRALRAGDLDPSVPGGPRRSVLASLAGLVERGQVVKGPGKGVYVAAEPQGR